MRLSSHGLAQRCAARVALAVALGLGAGLGCEDTLSGPSPELAAPGADRLVVEPGILCHLQRPEEGTPVLVHGSGFSPLPYDIPNDPRVALPAITLSQASALDGGAGSGTQVHYGGEAGESNAELLSWQSQSQMSFLVKDSVTLSSGEGPIPTGVYDLRLENPNGNAASAAGVFAVVPPPTLERVEPPTVCDASAGIMQLTIYGTGFLRVDGADPMVTVGGVEVSPDSVDGCTPLEIPGREVESCTSVTVTVDASTYPTGDVEIVVGNPGPAACAISAGALFSVVGPPDVRGVVPSEICSDVAETLTISGSNFAPGATVTVGGVEADSVTVNEDGTEITATFDSGLAAGSYDVTVDNGGGCSGTLANGITVNPTPLVFFVDPPVTYNGISIEVTIFTTGLTETAASVELIASDGTVTPITGFTSPDRPNRIIAPIPSGLPPDTYEVRVTSALGCVSSLNGRLVVTDTLTVALAAIDPAFASPTIPTAVTITAEDPAPPGEVQFEPVPRVYLNPNPSGAGIIATALRAVVLEDPAQLSAVIPGGMTPGQYDLVAVNPSGSVGLLPQALTVTAAEPPFVEAVAPGSLDQNTDGQAATVVGRDFDTAGATVELECRDFATGAVVASGSVSVDAAMATQLDVTVNASGIPAGAVCVVIVTNGDGSSYRYSAISFKEPSQNLNAWSAGVSMLEPRRALALAAGRPTDKSRFLYAIGGDDGSAASVKTSVEAVAVDPFGQLGSWSYQRNDLALVWDGAAATAMPRCFAGVAKVDRFIYLVGGDGGAGPVATLLRAEILDPLDGPEILDLDARLGDGSEGLGEGLWYYQVAAIFPTSDARNPGGESLAGEVLNVQLPAIPERIVLTLSWQQVAGASGYRVYRTPVADDVVTNMELLAEVAGGDTLTLEDTGSATDGTTTPFPRGSLGVWHTVASAPMGTARAAMASVAVQDPADPGRWFLYAVGGRGAGGVLASGELATITVNGDGSQTVSAWQPLGASLSTGRAELPGYAVSNADTPVVPAGEVYLFFGPGHDGNRAQGLMEVQRIGADGQIASLIDTGTPRPPAAAGSAGLAANGFLFMFGGRGGAPTNNDWSGEVVAPLPAIELDSGGSLGGGGMLVPRQYQGAAQESAFFFIAGGTTATETASATVEQTVQ